MQVTLLAACCSRLLVRFALIGPTRVLAKWAFSGWLHVCNRCRAWAVRLSQAQKTHDMHWLWTKCRRCQELVIATSAVRQGLSRQGLGRRFQVSPRFSAAADAALRWLPASTCRIRARNLPPDRSMHQASPSDMHADIAERQNTSCLDPAD